MRDAAMPEPAWEAVCNACTRRSPASLAVMLGCAVLAGSALSGCEPHPEAAALQRGQRLLAQYQCGSCHVVPGVAGAGGHQAVPLAAFGVRSYIAGRLPNDRETLVQWIVSPASLVPGTPMPDMGVSEADARDMAAYLHSLQ
jgi:cytochrome c